MSATMEVEGLEKLIDKLNSLGKQGTLIQDEALIKAVQPVLNDAKNTRAFKDGSGRLRESIKVGKVKTKKGTRVIQVGDIDGEAFYGRMVEWGTTKMLPRPYLQPAYERNKDNIISTFRKAIEETMKNL